MNDNGAIIVTENNLHIGVWKDLLAEKDIRKKMDDLGIERTRSGRNTIWKPKAA